MIAPGTFRERSAWFRVQAVDGAGLKSDIADPRGMDQPRNTPASGRALLHGELTEQVIGAFFEVYKILRPGYLESTYGGAMALELTDPGKFRARSA